MSQFNRLAASVLRTDGASVEPEVEDRLKQAVENLPEARREIVVRRFGLDGGKGASLEDLGIALALTRERVRQLEAQTLEQLRMALEDFA